MKTLIIDIEGFDRTTLPLAEDVAASMARVAQLGRELLSTHRLRLDSVTCTQDLLDHFDNGATHLSIFGEKSAGQILVEPSFLMDAHITTCIAAGASGLTQRQRQDILTILGFLGAQMPCWLLPGRLPSWEEIQGTSSEATLPRVPSIYEELRAKKLSSKGFRPIKLGDALLLHDALKLKIHPAVLRLWEDLSHVTALHRRALAFLLHRRT